MTPVSITSAANPIPDKKIGQIDQRMTDLQECAEKNQQLVGQLRDRLTPVLGETTQPVSEDMADQLPEPPMAMELRIMWSLIHETNNSLCSILDLLEL